MKTIDRSYRRNIHTVVENLIPPDVIAKKNRQRSWQYRFYPEYDMVVISKDGTIGDILEINSLNIALPATPKKVRFEEMPQHDQKWRRYDVPKELVHFDKYFKDEPNPESKLNDVFRKHKEFIDDDMRRKREGDFLMIDGNPIYITGNYYFFLQHYKLTDMRRYGDFRMPQRDYFIFLEAVFADERCVGSLLLKSRRSAFSTSSGSVVLNKAITWKNGFFPIVSKKDTDAQILFDRHVVKPFLNLPKHLQPQRTGEVVPKKILEFSSPKKKLTTNNKSDSSSDGLDSIITFFATTVDAYDGTQVTYSINDEIGKFKAVDINAYWEQHHRLCHEVGSEIFGKAICGSTASSPNKGGKNYEKFYDDSKLGSRGESGFTKTGLYAIFIPADYTTMGFFDEFGYVIYDNPEEPILNELGKTVSIGVKQYLDIKEAECGDNIQKLNERKRNNPRVDTDAFLDEEASNMYATTGMVSTINYLKANANNPELKETYFRFDLYWKDKEKMIVEMKRHSKGKFVATSQLPIPLEFRNSFVMKDGKRAPKNGHLGAFGCDPYQSDRTKYNNGSKQGFVGMNTDNFNLPDFQKRQTFLFYNYRPNTRDEAEEDVIMACIYFSMPILPEINKKSLVEKMYKMDLRKYVLNNPLKKKKELTPDEEKYGGMISSNSGNSIPNQESALETYVQENFHEEIEHPQKLKSVFQELNEQAASYTRENRQSKDVVVAWMLACIATGREIKHKEPITFQTTSPVDIAALFNFEPEPEYYN